MGAAADADVADADSIGAAGDLAGAGAARERAGGRATWATCSSGAADPADPPAVRWAAWSWTCSPAAESARD